MSRETLKDFLNSKGVNSDRIAITLSEKPDGIGIEPSTEEPLLDLINDTKGLLGDYVKFLVDNSSNNFKIKGGNGLAGSSNKGDDLTIADSLGAENIFVEQGTVLKSKLNEYSNSKQFDASGNSLDSLIDKVGKNFSNHEKLKEIQGRERSIYGDTLTQPNGDNNQIVQATQNLFLQNNRFANVGDENSQSFTVKPQSVDQFEKSDKETNQGTYSVQNKFGKYDKDSVTVTNEQLKDLGTSLLLKSSGFSVGDTPGSSSDVNELLDDIVNKSANNVSNTSGYSKLDISNLRSKNAKGFPENFAGESLRAGRGDSIEIDSGAVNSKSFGTTYNSGFQFQGTSIKLHSVQAAISLIALKNVGETFWSSFIERLRTEDKVELSSSAETYAKENTKSDVLLYMLGQSRQLSSNIIDNHIFRRLLTNTTYSYGDAVDRGFDVVFDTPKIDRSNEEKVAESKNVSQSPGFWLAVARSVLKSIDNIFAKYNQVDLSDSLNAEQLFAVYKDIIDSNKFINFFNVLAVIGDISLKSTGGVKTQNLNEQNFKHPRDIDAIPDTRAIPGKSRKKEGFNKNELSWGHDETPSMYILPANIIRAAGRLNNTTFGESPVRAMFGSKLARNTYTGVDVDGSFNRIPNEIVKIVEDKLDAEYVPFYLQDLRTNEIISFNAFLTTLSDSINPNFTSISGYGRADAVQIYEGTSRSLNVAFTLYATNREDFDTMWYKINKLVTLLYPQYTPGTMVSNGAGSKFYQPFSQVMGASPIVRLRIGDIIKSNYSRFGLARTFGIGDSNVVPVPSPEGFYSGPGANLAQTVKVAVTTGYNFITDALLKVWLTGFGSPHSIVNGAFGSANSPKNSMAKIAKNLSKGTMISGLSNLLVNGFANPLAVDDIISQLRDPNSSRDDMTKFLIQTAEGATGQNLGGSSLKNGYQTLSSGEPGVNLKQMLLKPNVNNGYICSETGKKYLTFRRLKVVVVDKGPMSSLTDQGGFPSIIGYKIKIIDGNAPAEIGVGSQKHFIVRHSDIMPDPKELFNTSLMGALLLGNDPIAGVLDSAASLANEYSLTNGIPNEITDLVRLVYARDEAMFMRPEINPFVRAMETTKGRGLAGTIGQIQFNWLGTDGFLWEVDHNARAPIGCEISFGFNVIHDLPPGLDHSGYNRAPLYNVGEIMKNISGDVYSDDGRQSEFNFRKEGGKIIRVKGENNN